MTSSRSPREKFGYACGPYFLRCQVERGIVPGTPLPVTSEGIPEAGTVDKFRGVAMLPSSSTPRMYKIRIGTAKRMDGSFFPMKSSRVFTARTTPPHPRLFLRKVKLNNVARSAVRSC